MTTAQKIVYYRELAGLRQTELAEKVGITKQLLWKYETGRITNIPLEKLQSIAEVLHIAPSELAGWESPESYEAPEIAESYITFPIIAEAAAGYDRFAEYEDYSAGEIDIPLSWLHGRPRSDYFVIKVHGDSMFPAYQDGDLVLVLRQTTFNYSGQIGVVVYDDNMSTLKKVEYVMGEDWMRLVPINPAYPPIMIRDEKLEHCRVLGIAKMVIREVH